MTPGALPDTGRVTVGGVTLPDGALKFADPNFSRRGNRDAALWVTDSVVPDAPAVWAALARQFPTTGLWPLLIMDLRRMPFTRDASGRPWDTGEFDPDDTAKIDGLDGSEITRALWPGIFPDGDVDPDFLPLMKPFGAASPGLAEPVRTCGRNLSDVVMGFRQPARIGLVSVRRPADVLTRIGWSGPINVTEDMAEYSAVLRSWEDRFGAYVFSLGFASMFVAVERVPPDRANRQLLAAEFFSLANEQGGRSTPFRDVGDIAEQIARTSTWEFAWD